MLLFSLIGLICYLFNYIYADYDIWSHQLWLDPYEKFSLKWNISDEEKIITFLCEVETKGWIGLGLSPNGGMKGSDLIIAWINDENGQIYFHVS
jgi:hypothetical protein